MRLRAHLCAALIAGAVAALAAPAFAQPAQSEGRKMLQACGPDIQNFCGGVQPGGGRIASCLRPHLRQLSPECKGQLVEAHARRQQQQQQQQEQPPQ
jgi:hypothetical protein